MVAHIVVDRDPHGDRDLNDEGAVLHLHGGMSGSGHGGVGRKQDDLAGAQHLVDDVLVVLPSVRTVVAEVSRDGQAMPSEHLAEAVDEFVRAGVFVLGLDEIQPRDRIELEGEVEARLPLQGGPGSIILLSITF